MRRAGWVARIGLAVVLVVGGLVSTTAVSAIEPDPDSPDTLAPGQVMPPGSSLEALNGAFFLDMQEDGNLVQYAADGRPLWDAGTGGYAGASAVMQGDGNLVVVSAGGAPLWNSGTFGHPGAFLILQGDGNAVIYDPSGAALWASLQQGRSYPWQYTLYPGEALFVGDFLYVGRWRAVMQGDGNFVVYDGAQPAWSTGAVGTPAPYVTMQTDGNLVLYQSTPVNSSQNLTIAAWYTRTAGNGPSELRLQPDGNLVVYRADRVPTWWRTRDTSTTFSPFRGENPRYGVVPGASCSASERGVTGFAGPTRESPRYTCFGASFYDQDYRWRSGIVTR